MSRAVTGRKARGLALAAGVAMIFAMAAAPAGARSRHCDGHYNHARHFGHKVV